MIQVCIMYFLVNSLYAHRSHEVEGAGQHFEGQGQIMCFLVNAYSP